MARARHGVVAVGHSLDMEACANAIRSTVIRPGEVRAPILDKRPDKLSHLELAQMVRRL